MALLGEIKSITDAEAAIKEIDYHGCLMAVDNHYMRIGSQDPDIFRKEAESFHIQPGQEKKAITNICFLTNLMLKHFFL